MTSSQPRAFTPFGTLLGTSEGELNVFRGVRYARPPVGERRFRLPEELPLSNDTFDATRDGPVAPQAQARIAFAIGEAEAEKAEDCLTVTVWAPADAGDEKLPVMVWFHGGAFSTGGGSLAWYSGAPMAQLGRVIVVTVNSRLGVLGYMRMPGVSPGNLGLHDQLASLRWIQKSIAGFGGDPDNVTIFGQSAGGYAVLAMAIQKEAPSLFRRIIMQSGVLGRAPEATSRADELGLALADALGVAPTRQNMQQASIEQLFGAVGKIAPRFAAAPTEAFLPPFLPCIDGELLSTDLLSHVKRGDAAWCDMMIGYVREEGTVFAPLDPRVANLSREATIDLLRAVFGDRAEAVVDEYVGLRGDQPSATLIHHILGDTQFVVPSIEVALWQAQAGRAVFVYQFDWQSPQTDLGACHCLELPFLFGEPEAWTRSPMFVGAPAQDYAHLGHAMRSYWTAFARHGNPAVASLPPWPAYDDAKRTTMRLDRYVTPLDDLAGSHWRTVFEKRAY